MKYCMYSRDELFMRSPECYLGDYFPVTSQHEK